MLDPSPRSPVKWVQRRGAGSVDAERALVCEQGGTFAVNSASIRSLTQKAPVADLQSAQPARKAETVFARTRKPTETSAPHIEEQLVKRNS